MITPIYRAGLPAGEIDIPVEVLNAAEVLRMYLLNEPNCSAINGVMLKPMTGQEYSFPLSFKPLKEGQ